MFRFSDVSYISVNAFKLTYLKVKSNEKGAVIFLSSNKTL